MDLLSIRGKITELKDRDAALPDIILDIAAAAPSVKVEVEVNNKDMSASVRLSGRNSHVHKARRALMKTVSEKGGLIRF